LAGVQENCSRSALGSEFTEVRFQLGKYVDAPRVTFIDERDDIVTVTYVEQPVGYCSRAIRVPSPYWFSFVALVRALAEAVDASEMDWS
jgi:hypothetical protein